MRASLLALAIVAAAAPAHAQDDRREQARQQFELALQEFDAGNYEGALIAFEAAYDAVPNPRVLYNIGNVYAALNRSVEAVDAWERYLAGVENIDADRRAEVEASLTRNRARIGRVTFEVNVEGAIVTMDDDDVGTAPLAEPLLVDLGSHTFTARATGYDSPSVRVDVPGGVDVTVPLTLRPSTVERGRLTVSSAPEGVTVLLDGHEVGVTPMRETLPLEPGPHTVVGRRRGYLDATDEAVGVAGGEVGVRLELEVDSNAAPEDLGRLRVDVPGEISSLRVDGREVELDGGSVELPVGPHAVRLQVRDREALRDTVEIPSDDELVFAPELQFSQGALRDQSSGAAEQQTVGWALTVAGGGVFAVGLGVFLGFLPEYIDDRNVIDLFEGPDGCIPAGRACDLEHGDELDQRYMDALRSGALNVVITGSVVMGAGLATMVVGLVVALSAESPEDPEQPSAALRVRPGGLSLEGTF